MKNEFELWLRQAEVDLESARYNFDGDKLDVAALLCHQSAEKALKSLLIKIFKEIIKIHDLVALARKLEAPKEIIEDCAELNPIYLEARYPDYSDVIPAKLFSEEKIKSLLENAKEVLEWVKKKIIL